MSTPTRWVKVEGLIDDWKKQYYRKGKWNDKKKHGFTWRRIPFIIFGIVDINRERDLRYIIASLRMCAKRIFDLVPSDEYMKIIKELLISDEMENFKKAWKDATLGVIRKAIAAFPFPLPEFEPIAVDLMMFIAEKFYDFMFSL